MVFLLFFFPRVIVQFFTKKKTCIALQQWILKKNPHGCINDAGKNNLFDVYAFYAFLSGWSTHLEELVPTCLQWQKWERRRGEAKGNENWIQGGGNSSTTDSWCLGGGKSPWNEPLPSAQWGLNNKGRHSLQPDSLLANHRCTWQLHSEAWSQYKSFQINLTSCDLNQCTKSP